MTEAQDNNGNKIEIRIAFVRKFTTKGLPDVLT